MSNFYFPEDLLLDVLSRLPAKTLLCFKRVSKSWRDLIESRNLSKMNTNRLMGRTYSNPKIIVRGHSEGKPKLYTIDFSTNDVDIKEFNYPPLKYNKDWGVELLGSCNGVLCLHYAFQKIVLWNPLSHSYLELARPCNTRPSSYSLQSCRVYGFGYDKTTDDYKIVSLISIFDISDSSVSYDGYTYSLKLKRWKRLESFSYAVTGQNGILVNGFLHWITRDGSILAFDLADEKFHMVSLPNYSSGIRGRHIGVLGNYLSLICQFNTDYVFEMWVMKDYGVKDSWTRISLEPLLMYVEGYCLLMPIAYLESDKHVIFQDGQYQLFLYDLENYSVWRINAAQHGCLEAYHFLETLECYDFSRDETSRKKSRRKRIRIGDSDWKRIKP